MKYPEFANKLEWYFDSLMIEDVGKELPQGTNYSIWSWDVGDFSGDGNYDVAFVVKQAGEKGRKVDVYLFVDKDGFLTLIEKFPYEYVEMPLEVGVVIRSRTCFITKKIRQFNWYITGFKFSQGNLIWYDDFHTERIGKYTHETYQNYQTMVSAERYLLTSKDAEKFKVKFLMVPCYPRGLHVYKGFSDETYVDDVDFVNVGAWWWRGTDDASYHIKTAYDKDFMYLQFKIKDDSFVPLTCDSCPADYLSLWFDFGHVNSNDDRFASIKDDKVAFREESVGDIYNIKIYPGDFLEVKPFISKVSSTNELEDYQKNEVNNIKVSARLIDSGYVVKVRVPFRLFGYESAPSDSSKFVKIGFTSVLNDIDNEYRPEEVTEVASSSFNMAKPSSYGELLLVPEGKWLGNAKNIHTSEVLKFLMELGY
jgi:hypothetical protein